MHPDKVVDVARRCGLIEMTPRHHRGTMAHTHRTALRGARWHAAAALAALALFCGVAGAAPPPPTPGASSRAKQCCPPGVDLRKNESKCADGSAAALDCKVKFLLDGTDGDDSYEITPDGLLVLGNSLIERYCEAHRPGSQRNVSALVCFDGFDDDVEHETPRPQWWFDVATTLSWMSVVCLALTLAAHLWLSELRDLQGRCHMGAVASLGLGLLVLTILQASPQLDGVPCTVIAFLAYYWLLSAFFWLNVTAFNVWRSVVLEHVRFRESTLFAWYCAVSQGAPLALMLLLLAAHLLPEADDGIVRPRFGTNNCWFHDDHATWAWFYWPLAVLLGMNVIYFVWTTARLWRQYGNSSDSPGRRKLLQRRFLLSLKLFLIMGISWVFELISSAADVPGNAAWYLTDAINAMQGVIVLVVLVLTRRRAWRALHRRRPCGLRPPEHWAFPPGDHRPDDDDDSTDSEEDAEDQEMNDMSTRPCPTSSNGLPAIKANGVH
ncbi:probable G-protein coupled receptor Mth-like 2 [Frankliniella occidentalis]|uniref:Probable G-protein coupled receptor Mth-like 2 n=1 Tax=Frankliniella occidentalis TaxID=133901 RepID=A0A9C6U0K1_FRAOC|nr:probable G-protein coupled receptor Mth-like 2 [Frankliniella occidentalis]